MIISYEDIKGNKNVEIWVILGGYGSLKVIGKVTIR